MPDGTSNGRSSGLRLGAVTYLNSRPLILCLPEVLPRAEVIVDLPSRLADGLAERRLDVALVPSIECLRDPDYTIVSDACVACDGLVRSVRLYGRVPAERIRTLALDEGSRTSAALTLILLKERFGLDPQTHRFPIGAAMEDSQADAIMVVGDRGMFPPRGKYEFVWDLGEQWTRWTGLPFVFAMWIARGGVGRSPVALNELERALATARDRGVQRIEEIARQEAPSLGLTEDDCLSYLRDNLRFRLGRRQREGLRRFGALAVKHGLAPAGAELVFYDEQTTR